VVIESPQVVDGAELGELLGDRGQGRDDPQLRARRDTDLVGREAAGGFGPNEGKFTLGEAVRRDVSRRDRRWCAEGGAVANDGEEQGREGPFGVVGEGEIPFLGD
jgi:hypothetical protein